MHDRHVREAIAKVTDERRRALHHDEPLRGHPAFEQGLRHDAGAATQFDHEAVSRRHVAGNPPGEPPRARADRTHRSGFADPLARKQRGCTHGVRHHHWITLISWTFTFEVPTNSLSYLPVSSTVLASLTDCPAVNRLWSIFTGICPVLSANWYFSSPSCLTR